VLPSEKDLTIACFIAFPGTVIDRQSLALRITEDGFVGEVAPARTFVLESDILALRERGLIKGGTPELAVVAGRDAYLNPPLRFPDECVRHKILDFLGDLALVGGVPRGHFMVVRAGHASHLAFNLFLRKEDHLRWMHPPLVSQCR
jgi:UDP-3-O-[3-hydroxymyristoyl] N-acetylglucosamine deacetylase